MPETGLPLERLLDATQGLVTALTSGEAQTLAQHWQAREASIEALERWVRDGAHALSHKDRATLQRIQELDRMLLTELEQGLQKTRAELASIAAFRKSVRGRENSDVPRFLSYRA